MVTKKIIAGSDLSTRAVTVGKGEGLVFIGGPCAIENRDHALMIAREISEICCRLSVSWIYKSCYDKDCRSSTTSFHGVGIDAGLEILQEVRSEFGVPVVSDFSRAEDAPLLGEVCDMVQVPAYLCRQTHLLQAAARTGKPVHLKKGQFISPWNMKNSVRKIEEAGNERILLTERGTFFGYNMLVNDFRNLPIMADTGYPVCFDATHSVQMPTSMGTVSGGQREFIPHLVRAAAACGIDALFMEVHDEPPNALSDPNTVLDIQYLERILSQAIEVHNKRLELLDRWGEDNIHGG